MPRPNLTDFATILDNENMAPLFDLAWGAFKVPTEDAVAKSPAEAREALELYTQAEVEAYVDGEVTEVEAYVDGEVAGVTNTASIGLSGHWECKKTGLLVQWGYVYGNGTRLNYPIVFSSNPWLIVSAIDSGNNDYITSAGATTRSETGFNALINVRTGSVSTSIWIPNANAGLSWLALGRRA